MSNDILLFFNISALFRMENAYEPEWIEDIKELSPSKYRIDTQKKSQRLRQHAQGVLGTIPDGILERKGEEDTRTHPEQRSYHL